MFDDPAAAFEQFKSDVAAGVNKLIETFPGLKEVIGVISDAFTAAGKQLRACGIRSWPPLRPQLRSLWTG